jgi:hypothetical protein
LYAFLAYLSLGVVVSARLAIDLWRTVEAFEGRRLALWLDNSDEILGILFLLLMTCAVATTAWCIGSTMARGAERDS